MHRAPDRPRPRDDRAARPRPRRARRRSDASAPRRRRRSSAPGRAARARARGRAPRTASPRPPRARGRRRRTQSCCTTRARRAEKAAAARQRSDHPRQRIVAGPGVDSSRPPARVREQVGIVTLGHGGIGQPSPAGSRPARRGRAGRARQRSAAVPRERFVIEPLNSVPASTSEAGARGSTPRQASRTAPRGRRARARGMPSRRHPGSWRVAQVPTNKGGARPP